MPIPMLTEATLDAVAKAVFGHVTKRTEGEALPADKLYAWLRHARQQLAFQIALVRAYTVFARHHPEWVTSLFDEAFLKGPAAPLLARCLRRDAPADPAKLAITWAEALGLKDEARDRHVADVMPVATDFLRWLEAELRARPEFQPLFGGCALDQLAEAVEVTAQSNETLLQELREVSTQAQKYQVTVQQAQGLVIGDRATVTNVFQSFFDSDYASLNEYYLPVDEVFERVRLDDFVGRAWLESDLDEFLRSNDRGAWLLVGEAGIGKSTFLAHLVRERGYLHFFAEQAPGDVNLPRALQSLSAQLISHFRLEPYAGRDTLPHDLSAFPDFLGRLLRSVSDKLGAGESLVLVLDALDEAGVAPGQNVLGLPRQLPRGVYLILSQRPRPLPLHIDPAPHRMNLRAEADENQRDITTYLRRFASLQTVADQLHAHHYSPDELVRVLAERSAGNWIYLRYVSYEIRRGQRTSLDLTRLPLGLAAYYAEHWWRWRSRADWDSLYAPLLTTLAAAFEPLPIERLKHWAGVQASDHLVRRLMREDWRAFIYELDGGERRYHPYHASLREFLAGELEAEQLSPEYEGFIDELKERTREAHGRIVTDLRARCAGKWSELRDLYGRRYLSAHLLQAGENDELFTLVDSRTWYECQMEMDPSGTAYINDLAQAWEAAEAVGSRKQSAVDRGKAIGLQCRYALIVASIKSLTANIPTELLAALVDKGMLTPVQGLAYARQMLDKERQVAALVKLAPHLPEFLQEEVLGEALAAAQTIENRQDRAAALVRLVPHLPTPLQAEVLGEALAVVWTLEDVWSRAQALMALIVRIPQLPATLQTDVLQEALAVVWTIEDPQDREDRQDRAAVLMALAGLVPHLSVPLHGDILQEMLAVTRTIKDPQYRAAVLVALAKLVPHLPETEREGVLREALAAAQTIRWGQSRAEVLAKLVPYLPETEREEVLREALAAAQTIEDPMNRVQALVELVPHLPPPWQEDVLRKALAVARTIAHPLERVQALARLVPQLPPQQREGVLREALAVARSITHPLERAVALGQLTALLPAPQQQEVLQEVLARLIEDRQDWVEEVVRLVPHLPDPLQEEIPLEALARSIEDRQDREEEVVRLVLLHPLERVVALGQLTALLPAPQQQEVLQEVLVSVRMIHFSLLRAMALMVLGQLPLQSLLLSPGGDPLEEMLKVVNQSTERAEWLPALMTLEQLAPQLPAPLKEEVQREALAAMQMAFKELTRELREGSESDAEAEMREWNFYRAMEIDHLEELVPHLPATLREEALREALAVARTFEEPQLRAGFLAELAPHLSEVERGEVLREALTATRTVGDVQDRAAALARLVPHLSVSQQEEVLREVLASARMIEAPRERALALEELAPYLSAPLLREAIAEIVATTSRVGTILSVEVAY